MAPKQADKQQALPVEKPRPVGVTYLGARKGGKWEVYRVTMAEDGTLSKERVLEHPERLVARERLTTLLLSREVLP